jgi:predicted dithiol-disulfide oxidoreductase (DUF899 family)
MTFSSRQGLLLLALMGTTQAWAGLGENEGAIQGDRMRMRAFHSVARAPQYAVHELKSTDGSRVTQYVASNGLIFAVRWHTLYKPDMSSMLGTSFTTYTGAARVAAQRGGMQRQFLHQGSDLVMQSSGRMNVYSGFAYRPSLLPRGLNPQTLGLG